MFLENEQLKVEIDLKRGARVSSLKWHDLDFVLPVRPNLLDWGWYAMVPWAGRIRDGLISGKDGVEHQLPTDWDPPHAEHGFGFSAVWRQTDEKSCAMEMPDPYFGAVAHQRFSLLENSFRWTLEYVANGCDIPAWVGLHPWFKRNLGVGGLASLDFDATEMLLRGEDGIPTGEYSVPKNQPRQMLPTWEFLGLTNWKRSSLSQLAD